MSQSTRDMYKNRNVGRRQPAVKLPTKDEIDNFDISMKCQEWNMYSYERPAYTLWSSVGRALFAKGWTKDEIRVLLQSKHPRWGLDGSLGDAIIKVGQEWATQIESEKSHVQKWVEEGY